MFLNCMAAFGIVSLILLTLFAIAMTMHFASWLRIMRIELDRLLDMPHNQWRRDDHGQ